jgi:hypothetical protein
MSTIWGKPLSRFVLAVVVVTVVLGIYAVIAHHFGSTLGKIIGTTASVSAAMLLGLACVPALERRRLGPVPLVGMAGSVVAFALVVAGIWMSADRHAYWATTLTVLFVGLWGAGASLLSLARLGPGVRWMLPAAVVLSLVLACLGIGGVWAQPGTAYVRAVAVVSILVAGFTVAVPVLHRSSRDVVRAGSNRVAHCPACGGPTPGAEEERLDCPACGTRFRVTFLG